jgi:hypothetical protein
LVAAVAVVEVEGEAVVASEAVAGFGDLVLA